MLLLTVGFLALSFSVPTHAADTVSFKKKIESLNLPPARLRERLTALKEDLLASRRRWENLEAEAPDRYDYQAKYKQIDDRLAAINRYLQEIADLQPDTSPQDDSDSQPTGKEIGVYDTSATVDTAPAGDTSVVESTELPAETSVRTDTHPVTRLDVQPETMPLEKTTDTSPESETADTEAESETSDYWDHFFTEEGVVDAQLPGESELTVSGRKFIKYDLQRTEYTNNSEKDDEYDLNVSQQLQVKVRGSVADDLLEVKIDYDDSLPEVERQQIEVKYNGRERDLGFATGRASARFGDIQLSLPGTKYVSYSKNVFGLSGQFELTDFSTGFYNPESVNIYGVASQEKGETHKKVFEGQKQRRIPDPVADIYPVRRTYYQLLADTASVNRSPYLPIEVNSEEIYLDDRNEENNDANTNRDMVVQNGADTYAGDFDQLVAGEDYTIDYQEGIIRFTRNIANNYVIAVEAELDDGSALGGETPLMIKDRAESDTYDRYHLENRYRLASRNIVRDDPDRVLHIRDQNGNSDAPGDTPYVELLDVDATGDDDQIDDQHINFERGLLVFPDTRPFLDEDLPETNPTVYGPPSDRTRKYTIYQELLVEENSYQLGIDVVRGSEEVTVDGEKMVRNQDYTIDYQTGFLMFFDRVDLDEDSRIEVSYETLKIGQSKAKTFFGGRVEALMSDNLSFGATFMQDKESETTRIPQLGQESKQTTVREYDFDWKPLHTFQDYIARWTGYEELADHPWDKQVKLDLSGELARSTREPNQAGEARVDDFRGLEKKLTFARDKLEWLPADAPQQYPGPADTALAARSELEFEDVDGEGHEPDPVSSEDQRSLRVKLPGETGDTGDTWSAFQYQFSSSGEDLRGYQYIKFWVYWEDDPQNDAAGGTLSVDLGQLTEEINRDGDPQTEDDNNDQVLNPGEDDGFQVSKGQAGSYKYGANNSRLDGEDLDKNGRVDRESGYLHYPAVNRSNTVHEDTTSHNWHLYKIPLRQGQLRGNANLQGEDPGDTPAFEEVLKNAQTVRLVYESPGEDNTQQFLLEEMGVVRPTWRAPEDTYLDLEMASSAEDPRLPPPNTSRFRSSDQRPLDKAMRVKLEQLTAADSDVARTWYQFPGGSEIKNYKKLSLYFHSGDVSDGSDTLTAYLRFGTDRTNHFQYEFSLSSPGENESVTEIGENWYRLDVELKKFEEDMIDKLLSDSETLRRGRRVIRGDPSLLDVSWYELVFEGPESSEITGEVLFDYLTLREVRKESGTARYIEGELNLREELVNMNFSREEIEGEFRTIGLVNSATADKFVVKNTDKRAVNGSVDINRFIPDRWGLGVPFGFNWSENLTFIPTDRVERVRSDEVGEIDNENFSYNSGLNTPDWFPDFSYNYSEDEEEVLRIRENREWTTREETRKLSSDFSNSLQWQEKMFYFIPVGQGASVSTNLNYSKSSESKKVENIEGEANETPYDRDEERRKASFDFSFQPYSWLGVKPSYSYDDLTRKKENVDGMITRDQSVDFKFDFSDFLGFAPGLNFDLQGTENFNRGDTPVNKRIKVSGNSNFNLGTSPSKLWQGLDFLSLSYNFSLSGSGSYNDLGLEKGVGEVYTNFFGDLSWLWRGPDLSVSDDPLTLSRDNASKSISHSFNGNLDIWESLKTDYNFSYSSNYSQSDNSVRESIARSFSLDNRLALEKVSGWVRQSTKNTSLNFDYTLSTSSAERSKSRENKFSLGWSTKWNDRWNTNFNLNTSFGQTEDREVLTKNRSYSPSLDFKWLVNKSAEEGIVWFDNRLAINGNLTADINEKTKNGETEADNWEVGGSFGGSYNITSNIKTSFGGNFTVYKDRYQEGNNRRSYGIHGSTDFRF